MAALLGLGDIVPPSSRSPQCGQRDLGRAYPLPLAGLELSLLGLAFVVCSRHARDAETITLAGRALTRANLSEIRKGRAEWQRSVEAEQAAAAGHSTSRFSQADFGGYT
mgnify:CR=1 FL=1